jgi:hypothetical protein
MSPLPIASSFIVVVTSGLALVACGQPAPPAVPPSRGEGWLTGAPDQATKDERLEKYLRGFDQPMWEVGERYERVEQALREQNWALEAYHWEKIQATIEGGLMKRPKRRANAEALFLEDPWKGLHEALKGEDPGRIGPAFARAKGACVACHVAEQVPFINDQPLFREPLPQGPGNAR